MAINKETFCVYRWDQSVINFSSSEIRTCCRTIPKVVSRAELDKHGKSIFLNSDYLLERRKEMLEGTKHSDCRECWEMEAKGMKSFRRTQVGDHESAEKFLERVSGTDRSQHHFTRNPDSLILFIGNTCDLKCLYCGSSLSTTWAQEDLKYGIITQEHYDTLTTPVLGFDDHFWEFFEEHKKSIRHISFVGGEPLTMKRFYEYLEKISKSFMSMKLEHKVTLCITSNLNASEKTFNTFLDTIRTMTSPMIEIKVDGSIDTTGEKAAYIRSGVSWERWKSNFIKLLELKEVNLKLTVIPSISALSVTSFGTLIQELASLQKKYHKEIRLQDNIIMTPAYLSPLILTPDFAASLRSILPVIREAGFMTERHNETYADFIERLMLNIQNGQDELMNSKYRREFYGFIIAMDKRRQTNFLSTFPEMKTFYEVCESGWV